MGWNQTRPPFQGSEKWNQRRRKRRNIPSGSARIRRDNAFHLFETTTKVLTVLTLIVSLHLKKKLQADKKQLEPHRAELANAA